MRDGVSLSDQRKYRPVISPTELMKLENLEAYIKLAETGVLGKTKFTFKNISQTGPVFCAKEFKIPDNDEVFEEQTENQEQSLSLISDDSLNSLSEHMLHLSDGF